MNVSVNNNGNKERIFEFEPNRSLQHRITIVIRSIDLNSTSNWKLAVFFNVDTQSLCTQSVSGWALRMEPQCAFKRWTYSKFDTLCDFIFVPQIHIHFDFMPFRRFTESARRHSAISLMDRNMEDFLRWTVGEWIERECK